MDSQIESARIQGKSAIVAAIITATITGIFSIVVSVYSYNHISYLLKSIDDLNAKNDALSNQIVELKSDLSDSQISYSDLQELYDASKNQYAELNQSYIELDKRYQKLLIETGQTDTTTAPNKTVTEAKWLDQLDIFYQEGKHISGSASDGWCKIWDSSLQKDSLGDEHNHGIYVRGYREDIYIIEYTLDDIYTGFKGLFTLEYESRNVQIESNFKVYSVDDENGERNLLYSTPQSLYGGVKPISFDFPTYGAEHIRIEISSGSGDKGEFLLALVDTCFYK